MVEAKTLNDLNEVSVDSLKELARGELDRLKAEVEDAKYYDERLHQRVISVDDIKAQDKMAQIEWIEEFFNLKE